MNVLYVCADRGIPVCGSKGASVHVRSITAALDRLGHRVTLAARRWGDGNPAPTVHRCASLDEDFEHAVAQLSRLIVEERPDVCIERYSLDAPAARIATRRHGVPLTLEVNAPLYAEATRYRGLDDPAARGREHAALRSADRVHAISEALLRYVRSIAPDVPSVWIPSGAEVARFRDVTAARASATDCPGPVIGFAGSMKKWHGVEQLLEAFARIAGAHRDARLLVIGGGPRLDGLVALADRLGIGDAVTFTGAVPHREVPRLLARVDLAVAPYLPQEDFYFQPLKVLEYIAAGKALIYADQGDLRSLVGDAGRGYPAGDVAGLAALLGELLGDPRQCATMAAAARRRRDALDWSVIARRVVRFAAGGLAELDRAPVAVGST